MQDLPLRASVLEDVAWDARRLFAFVSVFAPESAKLRHFARLGAQANAVLFRFAAFAEQDVRAAIEGLGTLELAWYRPRSKDEVWSWLCTYSFAAMARDQAVLDCMAAIPIDVTRQSSSHTDEYRRIFAAAVQSFHRQDERTRTLLRECRAAAVAERLEVATPEMLPMTTGLLDALEGLLERDEDRLNEGLMCALTGHQAYCLREDNRLSYDGFVDVESLGLACLAHDAGLEVRVDSEYLPRAVILDRYAD